MPFDTDYVKEIFIKIVLSVFDLKENSVSFYYTLHNITIN